MGGHTEGGKGAGMKVYIDPFEYDVEDVQGLEADKGEWGEVVFDKCQIKIDSNLTGDFRNETILHEIVHALLRNMGEHRLSSENEKFVSALSMRLYSLLTRNSELTKMLTRGHNETQGQT